MLEEIEARHLDALATSEALISPGGVNSFDDTFKQALFGRCFVFMDAQDTVVAEILRKPA